MRHPLFLTNLVLLILITSCSEDLYEDATENNRVKTVTIEDVPFLKENINQRRASFKSTSKNAVDYFSLIETQGILLVEKADGSKDYTFALKLPYQDTLTNLIAQEKNNVFTYSLLKYNAENQAAWLQGLEGPNPFAIPVNVTQTDLEGKSLAPSDYCPRLISICPSGLHTLSSYHLCNYYFNEWTFNVVSEPCPIEGGGGDTTPNNGGGSTIGGGSNTSTSPKPCKTCDFSGAGNTPCENLKKVSNNPYIKAGMIELKPKYTDTQESGYRIKMNSDGTYLPPEEALLGTGGTSVLSKAGGNYVGVLHVHFQDYDPEFINHDEMFSDDDIFTLYKIADKHNSNGQPKNYNDYFVHMCNKYGTYMIKIKNWEQFYAFMNSSAWNKNVSNRLRENYNKLENGTSTQYINTLLYYLEDKKAGIGIYVADDDFKWSELNLAPGGGTNKNILPKKTPCPN